MQWLTNARQFASDHRRSLIFTAVLIGLAVLAGGTDIFTEEVHKLVGDSFRGFFDSLKPKIAHFLIAAILVSIAWTIYPSVCKGFNKMIDHSGASNGSKDLLRRLQKVLYWVIVVVVVMYLVAEQFAGKVVFDFSIIIAALTVSLQAALGDFFAGLQLQFSRRVKVGYEIEVVDTGISGTVVDIGTFETLLKGKEGGFITVSNREFWKHAIRVQNQELPGKGKADVL